MGGFANGGADLRGAVTAFVLACAGIIAGLAAAPTAGAATEARFSVSINGSFSSSGSGEQNCFSVNEERFRQTVSSQDAVTFSSSRSGTISVRRVRGVQPQIGIEKAMRVAVVARRSNALSPDEPCRGIVGPPKCGERKRTVKMGVFGREVRSALYYQIVDSAGPLFPEDPMDASCNLYAPQLSWWKLNNATSAGSVSKSKLFDESVDRIKVKGHSTKATNKLDYTITLQRR